MGQFALDISRFVEAAKERPDMLVRAVALELTKRVVLRTPVGNPDLWKANAAAALQRAEHNDIVDQINATLASDPRNVTPKGNLKRKVRSKFNRRLSKSQLAKTYPYAQGAGYVGGRMRGSWQVTINAPSTNDPNRIDPSGGQAIAAAAAAVASAKAGPPIFIVSNVPYAIPIENGHSKQAPTGVVKITAMEFQGIVDQQAQRIAT